MMVDSSCNCGTTLRKSGILTTGGLWRQRRARENEVEALHRELREELELEFGEPRLFTRFEFDMRPIGLERKRSFARTALSA